MTVADFISDLAKLLGEKAYKAGTVRTWGDHDFEKQSDGSWEPVTLKRGKGIEAFRQSLAGRAHPKDEPKKKEPAAPPRKWIASVPGFPGANPTLAKPPGKYGTAEKFFTPPPGGWTGNPDYDFSSVHGAKPSEERQKLHDSILKGIVDHVEPVPEGQKPVAILMMGAPASGKSTATKGMDLNSFVHVDADNVKASLPEYEEATGKSARNAAVLAHEESSYIAKKARDYAIDNGMNLLMDGTGASEKSYSELIDHLRKKGYHISILFTQMDDPDEGVKRATDRANKNGRYVPEEFIRNAYKKVPKNFEKFASNADEFAMFDTSRDPAPLVWRGQAGEKEQIYDKAFVRKFRDKYEVHDIGSEVEESLRDELRRILEGDQAIPAGPQPQALSPAPVAPTGRQDEVPPAPDQKDEPKEKEHGGSRPPAIDMADFYQQFSHAMHRENKKLDAMPDEFDVSKGEGFLWDFDQDRVFAK